MTAPRGGSRIEQLVEVGRDVVVRIDEGEVGTPRRLDAAVARGAEFLDY